MVRYPEMNEGQTELLLAVRKVVAAFDEFGVDYLYWRSLNGIERVTACLINSGATSSA